MLGQLHALVHRVFDFLLPPSVHEARVRTYTLNTLPIVPHTDTRLGIPITALWKYNHSQIRDIIWSLKYRHSRSAASICAEAMAEYLQDMLSEAALMHDNRPLVCIPIPLSKERQAMRGYNQVEFMLKELQKQLPTIHIETRALIKTRHTPPQTSLKRAARLKNMKGAFEIRSAYIDQLKKARIFLLDDVTTTGSTLAEAATVLKKGGIDVECIAMARTGE